MARPANVIPRVVVDSNGVCRLSVKGNAFLGKLSTNKVRKISYGKPALGTDLVMVRAPRCTASVKFYRLQLFAIDSSPLTIGAAGRGPTAGLKNSKKKI